MIVSEKNVSDALTYLADDPHPVAIARKDLTLAENEKEAIFASLYLSIDGPVKERECYAKSHHSYREAQEKEANASADHERHRARIRAAEMLIEVWRSENANARAAERVR